MPTDACAFCGLTLTASDEASLNQECLEHGMEKHATELNSAIDQLESDVVKPSVVAAIVRRGEDDSV